MNTDEYGSNEITEKIIRYVYVVANTLGNAFLERFTKMLWHMS